MLSTSPESVTVPIEPTREMWAAMANAVIGKTSVHHDVVVEAVYRAMVTSAPAAGHTQTPDPQREQHTGAYLLQMAKSLGWPDDGEGALEFVLRRCREVAFEDCGKTTSSDTSTDREGGK